MEAAQTSRRSLGEILVQRGLLSDADLDRALAEQLATGQRLADILVLHGLVTGHDNTSALEEQLASFNGGDTPDLHVAETPAADEEALGEPEGSPGPGPRLYSVGDAWTAPGVDLLDASDEPSEDDHAPELVLHEPLVDPATLIRDADERRRGMESTVSALGPILEGVERIRAELEEHDLATPLLAQELAATQERIVDRSEALSAEIVHLKETREEIERTAGLLDELRVELDGKQDELAEMRAEAAIWASRVVDLETEVESLTARADGAARDLDRLAAACDAAPPVAAIAGTDEDHDPAEATDEGD